MERRRCVRIPVYLELTYQKEREATPSHLGIAHDISQSGMGLRQYGPLQVGHRIYVALTLPYQGMIHLRGIVIWCAPRESNVPDLYHAGLRWIKVDSTARARLNAFLNGQIRVAKESYGSLGSSLMGVLQEQMKRSEEWSTLLWVVLLSGLLASVGTLFWLSLR